ncbi:MAG: hypothetical protein WKF41_15000 [Gaiellaceae bacterium]
MRIVLAIGLAAALVGCFGAGCAGEPAAEPEPVVRQSELRGAQAVREVVAIRTAGANAGVLSTKIFGTIAAAGRQSRAEGGRLLRRELPPLLAAAATVWPRSYRAIAAQAPRREAARRQRAILLRAVRSEQASLARLRRELRGARDVWPPVLRFDARSGELRRRLAVEIDAMMSMIPASESEALRRAFAGG